eukprot:2804287-Lingulodinium_polyedra.AAC.1
MRVDGTSHSRHARELGRRRFYVACRAPGHVNCRKFKFVDDFPTERKCAVWLFAWHAHGPSHESRLAHNTYVPPAAVLDSVELRLRMTRA